MKDESRKEGRKEGRTVRRRSVREDGGWMERMEGQDEKAKKGGREQGGKKSGSRMRRYREE